MSTESVTATALESLPVIDRSILEFRSETEYADPARYFRHRAELIESWGARVRIGERILQLGCGDGYLAGLLVERGFRVCATDKSKLLLERARIRNSRLLPTGRLSTRRVDINDLPLPFDEPVDHVVAVMRSFTKYATDRGATLREIQRLCTKKVILDFAPRMVPEDVMVQELVEAGFCDLRVRAFLFPQRRRLAGPVVPLLTAWERVPFVYRMLTRRKFHLWIMGTRKST